MKRLILTATLFLIGNLTLLAAPCAQQQPVPCPGRPAITFVAVAITAGPYGQLWTVTYDGGAYVKVKINYMLSPMGDLSGEFIVSAENLEKIARIAREEKFLSLPAEITPPGILPHAPDLRLKLSIDGKDHKVNLYDPAWLGATAEAKRFFSVWNEVFALLPYQPTWHQ